jgi:hypothetical protein
LNISIKKFEVIGLRRNIFSETFNDDDGGDDGDGGAGSIDIPSLFGP